MPMTITARISTFASVRASGFRAGLSRGKDWIKKIWTLTNRQADRGGAVVQVDRTADRDGDRYTERVTLVESGEVIRDVDEPLTEHRSQKKI